MNIEEIYKNDSELFKYCDVSKVKELNNRFESSPIKFITFLKKKISTTRYFDLTPFDVVQYSNFDHCTDEIVKILYFSGNKGFSYEEVGEFLLDSYRKPLALKKYGENHSKTASILGLTMIIKVKKRTKVFLTNLGCFYYSLDPTGRHWLLKYLILRSKYIDNLIKGSVRGTFLVREEISFLKESTVTRRLPNLKRLYSELINGIENEMSFITLGVDYSES
jgi:hypothetical protein